jgi:septum site-determining protein MinC
MAKDPAKPFEFEGMVTALNVLRVQVNDLKVIAEALDVKVKQSPMLFQGAPVVIDVSALEADGDGAASADQDVAIEQLARMLKEHGLVPVGAYAQSAARVQEAAAAGLPIIDAARGKKRGGGSRAPQPWPDQEKSPSAERARAAAAAGTTSGAPTRAAQGALQSALMLTQPLRAGQIVHAENRDAIALAAINSGAELLADGNIHVYAPLRGRAIAGARGDEHARIFCQKLEADLVAIAGVYLSADELPEDKVGKAVQIALQGGELVLTELSVR